MKNTALSAEKKIARNITYLVVYFGFIYLSAGSYLFFIKRAVIGRREAEC